MANEVTTHRFSHVCACCERLFQHSYSREDMIKMHRKMNPGAPLELMKVFCPKCLTHTRIFPDRPYFNFLFRCHGCKMAIMKEPSSTVDDYPVLTVPGQKDGERVCLKCHEKASAFLN